MRLRSLRKRHGLTALTSYPANTASLPSFSMESWRLCCADGQIVFPSVAPIYYAVDCRWNHIQNAIPCVVAKVGINECARESGFDRKNFIRKLVRDIAVKRNSYAEFERWLKNYKSRIGLKS